MNDDVTNLLALVDRGLSRRGFLVRSAAFGAGAMIGGAAFPALAQTGEPKKGGILKLGIGGGESTDPLDPGLADGPVAFHVNRQWGDTITAITPDKKVVPRLVEGFESNPELTVWRFKTRAGVKFHDGSDLTVNDLVASIKRHSNPEAKSGALGVLRSIVDVKAEGDVLVLTLDKPNIDMPYLLSAYHLVVQPNGGLDNPNAGIGTGPYKIITAKPGERYVFEKFKDDWDQTRGHYDGVEITIINDNTARMAALQSGQVHVINDVDPKVVKLLGRAPNIQVNDVPGPAYYNFIMHCDAKPFDNNDLRLALKYAINRQEMVDKILRGHGTVGNDFPVNETYPLFEALPQREFSIEKAAEHYKKSGHDGSPIELYVAETAFPGAVDAAVLYQQTAKQAGIPLEIKRVPDDGYWSEVWNIKPFCASYWGGRAVQDQVYSTAYISGADWNDTKFKNPEFDALIIEARDTADPEKRKEIYKKAATIMNEEGGAIIAMFNNNVDAMSTQLAGYYEDSNFEMMGGYLSSRTWFA